VHAGHACHEHAPHANFVDIAWELVLQVQSGHDRQEPNAKHALCLWKHGVEGIHG